MPKAPKTITVTVSFEMSEVIARSISSNSIERVINTTLNILEKSHADTKHEEGLVDINYEDWLECKSIVVHMWDCVRDAIFRVNSAQHPQSKPWRIM